MEIEFLWFEGCPNQMEARRLLQETLLEMGIDAPVQEIRVTDPEETVRLRFIGSPTIRVNGSDIEPIAEAETVSSMACRVYHTPQGPQGWPSKEMLRAALARS